MNWALTQYDVQWKGVFVMDLDKLLVMLGEDNPLRAVVTVIWQRMDALEKQVDDLVESHG